MKTTTIILTLIFAVVAFGEVIHVPNHIETIQEAIDASEDGDSIMVAPDVYVENINFSGKAISLIGNPTDPADVVIYGRVNGGSVVVFNSEEDENSVLSGFTITMGSGRLGGGVFCDSSASPVLSDLIITDNSAGGYGGGIFCEAGASPIMSKLLISDNEAGSCGGGIYLTHGASIISNITVSDNWAQDRGGGIFSFRALTLTDAVISNNSSARGGGLFVSSTNPSHYERVIVEGNMATERGEGGGMYLMGSWSAHTMLNVTITDNYAGSIGGVYLNGGLGELTIANSIIYGNSEINIGILFADVTVTHSDIGGGQNGIQQINNIDIQWNDDSIDEDPLFLDPDGSDYNLTEHSPCVDTGDPDAEFDPDGTRADMGALYLHQKDIDIVQQSLEFVGAQTGSVDSMLLIIANIGLTTLRVNSITISPDTPFYLSQEHEFIDINPEGHHTEWVKFAPESQDDFNAVLTVESNDPDESVVELSLIGSALPVEGDHPAQPLDFSIVSVTPNPFNANTTISYTLSVATNISLELYNLLGQRLQTLFEGNIPAGTHSASLNGSELPSGLYFVRLSMGKQASTQKVMLIK